MHSNSARLYLAIVSLPVALTACAAPLGPVLVSGALVPRITREFTGQPYSIRHSDAHPSPGNPSSGVDAAGGQISGTICGADIQYQVTHHPDHVRVSGFINNQYSVALEIREANHIRRIQGGLGNFVVDVLVADDLVAGMVGRWGFQLHPDSRVPDQLSERFKTNGYLINLRFNGSKELAQLPAADQAALVPLMLRCGAAKIFENMGHDPPELGFGGPIGAQPPKTINFGS